LSEKPKFLEVDDQKVQEYACKIADCMEENKMEPLEAIQALWECFQFQKRYYGVEFDECSPRAVELKNSMDLAIHSFFEDLKDGGKLVEP